MNQKGNRLAMTVDFQSNGLQPSVAEVADFLRYMRHGRGPDLKERLATGAQMRLRQSRL